MSGIADAASLWAAGDREGALEALCVVWAQTHALDLGELCEQISEQLVRERRLALQQLSAEERHATLMDCAKAGDRVAVHALLPWLTSVARPKARQRIAFLRVPDPLLLRSLVVWLRRRPELNQVAEYLANHRSFWLGLLYLWLWRDKPLLERDRYGREVIANMRELREEQSLHELSRGERDELATLRRIFAAEQPADYLHADALFEAVYERPEDDDRRAVLADFLLSCDEHEPRGEFINLQLGATKEPLSEVARARERELLDLHGFRWLGPFVYQCHVASARFARGFLVELALRWGGASEHEYCAPGHPIWATIETLDAFSGAIVSHPVMRSLRTLACDLDTAEVLLRGPARPTVEMLSVAVHWSPTRNPDGNLLDHGTVLALARELFARLDAAPNLRHLRIHSGIAADPVAWQWIWQGARARLESVRLNIEAEELHLSQWIEQLRRDDSRVELLLDHGMHCFALLPADGYRAVRVSDSWQLRMTEEMALRVIVTTIAPTLGSTGLRRIELVGKIVDADRLRAALRERGADTDALEIVAVGCSQP